MEDVEAPRKSRISSWKSTIRRSLGCGTSKSISKPYPMEWAKEKIPAVAEEFDRARRQADRAHQDVLETLQKMALAATSPARPGGQDQHAPRGVSADVAYPLGSPVSVHSAPTASDTPPEPGPGPGPGPEPRRPAPPGSKKEPEAQQPQGTSEPPSPPTTLEALLYFAVERPNRGGFVRHYHRPLRLDLSTPRARAAAARTLRGYLTDQPARFLSHFGLAHRPGPRRRDGGEGGGGLAVCVSQLSSYGLRARVEGTWGRGVAWADAREEAFAPALVGLLGEMAAARAARMGAATVDVCVIVRQMFCCRGRRDYDGMNWEMDVRRVTRGS